MRNKSLIDPETGFGPEMEDQVEPFQTTSSPYIARAAANTSILRRRLEWDLTPHLVGRQPFTGEPI